MTYPIDNIKKDFSMIGQIVGEKTLCYLDSTATTLKPNSVIDAMNQFYRNEYSSVKRGVYKLSEATTQKFERVRGLIQNFIGAKQEEEIIFTRGTTESINLVASTWGRKNISKGDVIVLSALEHHANIVPWQMLTEEKEAVIKVIPADDKGNLIVEEFDKYVSEGFKFLSIGHIANSIGTVNDVEYFCSKAKEIGATVLIDAAQSIAHATLNVKELNCDFLAFSGHKLYGPTGIGVLYGKYELLEVMPPYHGGGEMIDKVTFTKTTYAKPPARFEAGTPAIAEVIGLGAAIDYVLSIGLEQIAKYEHDLLEYLKEQLLTIEGIQFVGEAKNQAGIQSFILPYAHAFDIGMILDEEGVAIRTGHHCAQPVMDHFGVSATVRASIGIYNDKADIDVLIKGLKRVEKIFA